jgi:hypothetical protein
VLLKSASLIAGHAIQETNGVMLSAVDTTLSAPSVPSADATEAGAPPFIWASHVNWLYNIPPVAVFASDGDHVSLSSILTGMFGSQWTTYTGFELAYYGPQTLQDWDFNYWNPDDPQVARWYVNGNDIGPAGDNFTNVHQISAADVASSYLVAGNNISNFAYIEVPIGYNSQGQITAMEQFSLVVVDPAFKVDTHGAPTAADIVASAEAFSDAYSGLLNDNDCDKIACALSSAVGAALNIDMGDSTDPTQNESGGFWRVVYRGSDPSPVHNWQTLVKAGDIVRMGWEGGGHHTTTVLSVNSNGTMQVFDNDAFTQGGDEIIGTHTANYQNQTDPTTITIFRLSSDHLYLINGSDVGEVLTGTGFDDKILGFAGDDTLQGGIGRDVLYGYAGKDTLLGGKGADTLYGYKGADHLDGGSGSNTFRYRAVSDSTGSKFDTVSHVDFQHDTFDLWFSVGKVDAAVAGATLSKAHFDADMKAALSGHLKAHDAILVKVAAGHYAGDTFLVVDANGTAGYQAGHDLVVSLDHASHLGSLSTGDFV